MQPHRQILAPGRSAIARRIEITPERALVDETVTIRLCGFEAGQLVTLRATLRDDLGHRWTSEAAFEALEDGVIDPAEQCPKWGSYDGVDPMGLFWSMAPEPRARGVPFAKTGLAPTRMTFSAEIGERPVASASLERLFVDPLVVRVLVREKGVVGTLFLPPGPGPHPAVIVLAGWPMGGVFEPAAALLASRGYAALALGYFNFESLPKTLGNFPLEYFETAIGWLRDHRAIDGERLAVVGYSKGGELSLVLGATFPEIRAVVGVLASGVVFQAPSTNPLAKPLGAWSHRGQPLPFLRLNHSPSVVAGTAWKVLTRSPLQAKALFRDALGDPAAVERATIPVEKINGPVLLLSGEDDRVWPSPVLCEIAVRRLADHEHPSPYQHICYPGAGHEMWFSFIHQPSTVTHIRASGVISDQGGNAKDDAFARANSWAQIQRFLGASLYGERPADLPT